MKQTDTLNHNALDHDQVKRKRYFHYYFKILIQGLIISLPIAIIFFLLSLGFKLIFNFLSPISVILHPKASEPHWSINILSLLVLLGIFFAVGLLVRNQSGKAYFKNIEEEYLCKIPLYTGIRDLVQRFTGFKKTPFSRVVLVDIFNSGVLMTGFITEEITNGLFTVFVPTAPNPTNGNIYHIPASRIKFVDIKPENAIRTVVGMGIGSSCLFVPDDIKKNGRSPLLVRHKN